MARVKKSETTLTLEEKLEQALVPDWEWPYKVPENWCWTKMGSVCVFERGITFPASAKSKDSSSTSIPCLRTTNVQEELDINDLIYVDPEYMKGNEAKIVRQNDIIMSSANSRELVGKVSFVHSVPFPMTFGGFVLNIRAKGINSKFLFYFLRHEFLNGKFMGQSTQTTNIANISTSTLNVYGMPLPPIDEQQHIVERIDSLFSKLDEAKEKAQATLDSFETRKATILHKAFTGELTSSWRKERNISTQSWNTTPLSQVSILQTGLMKGKKPKQKTVKMPYLRVANVQDGFLDLDEINEIEASVDQIDRYKLRVGDVLFTEGGDFDKLGRGAVWEGQIATCLHQNHIFVVRPDPEILDPYFLSYQAGSKYGKDYFVSCAKQTTNLASINSTQLKCFPVLIPTMEEQIKIVEVIQELLEKEQQARNAAEVVVEQIDLMKKAILSRAFRGELGTSDPTEEGSIELLKSILNTETKETAGRSKRSRIVIPDKLASLLSSHLEREIVKVFYKENADMLPMSKLMSVSSKKFEVLGAIKKLQQKGIVEKINNGNFRLMR